MKKVGYLLFYLFWSNIVFGQVIDSLGVNKYPLLNSYESNFLVSQLENESFDFENKKIAFYKSNAGIQSKQDFFEDSIEHIRIGHKIPIQIIELTPQNKSETGGFDAVVVSWYKFILTPKMKEKIIEKLKK